MKRVPTVEAARPPPSRLRPSHGVFAVRRPSLSPLMQMALLSRLQSPLQYGSLAGYGSPLAGYGSPLAGYGSSPIILLQPIIVPVPMSAGEAEQQPNALSEQAMSRLTFRQPVKPRPVSLVDIIQRGNGYGF